MWENKKGIELKVHVTCRKLFKSNSFLIAELRFSNYMTNELRAVSGASCATSTKLLNTLPYERVPRS